MNLRDVGPHRETGACADWPATSPDQRKEREIV